MQTRKSIAPLRGNSVMSGPWEDWGPDLTQRAEGAWGRSAQSSQARLRLSRVPCPRAATTGAWSGGAGSATCTRPGASSSSARSSSWSGRRHRAGPRRLEKGWDAVWVTPKELIAEGILISGKVRGPAACMSLPETSSRANNGW